jgi:hypothetical protein
MNHHKWLKKRGLLPEQIKKRKKELGSPNSIPDYSTVSFAPLSNSIPANGTKETDMSKSKFWQWFLLTIKDQLECLLKII